MADEARFWSRVDRSAGPNGCWIWPGYKDRCGYGSSRWPGGGRRVRQAHRVAWFYTHGSFPDPSMHLDHLCRVRACVNPSHLEEVTPRENVLRSTAPTIALGARAECNAGHPFSGDNLAIRRDGTRKCRRCHRDYMRAWNARRRVAS